MENADVTKRVKAIYRDSFNFLLEHLPRVVSDGDSETVWQDICDGMAKGAVRYNGDPIADALYVTAFDVLEMVWKEHRSGCKDGVLG